MKKSVPVKIFLVCSLLAVMFTFLTDVTLAEASRQDDLRRARVIVQDAKKFMNSGNFIEAARSFEKLIPLYPSLYPSDHEGYANLYFSIGGLYLKGASYDEAIPYCKKSIEMSPSHFDYYRQTAMCYVEKKDPDNAVHVLTEWIEKYPDSEVEAYVLRGMQYMDVENYQNALSDFQKVIELDKKGEFTASIMALYGIAEERSASQD